MRQYTPVLLVLAPMLVGALLKSQLELPGWTLPLFLLLGQWLLLWWTRFPRLAYIVFGAPWVYTATIWFIAKELVESPFWKFVLYATWILPFVCFIVLVRRIPTDEPTEGADETTR